MPLLRPLLLLPLIAVASGCNLSGQVEAGIENALPDAIGPAESYDVTVAGLRARAGEADRVEIVGRRVEPDGAPVLDRLDLVLTGVHYDRGGKRLERVESAHGVVRVLPADLAAFLNGRDGVREATVTLRAPDRATVRVRPQIGDLALPRGVTVELDGRLRADDGRVRLDVNALRAAGLDLGQALADELSDRINPVVDLSETRPALSVTDVRVDSGAVVLEAEGDLSGLRLR